MPNRTSCLINDSFPPVTDGVANAVVNYARVITESGSTAGTIDRTMASTSAKLRIFPNVRFISAPLSNS